MMNSSLGGMNVTENYYNHTNGSFGNKEETNFINLKRKVWAGIFIICCIGSVGNGYIIWLLGFQMKRNSFTTFILNLAVADFGFLISIAIYYIIFFLVNFKRGHILFHLCDYSSFLMFTSANFLLTAISIDRCVAVHFPIWHRCSRPKHLSSAVCAFLWISSFLLAGIMIVMEIFLGYNLNFLCFLLTAIVCLPLISISTVVLFIKVCFKSKQKNKGRLLLMILITLLCFIILAFPLSVLLLIIYLSNSDKGSNNLEHLVTCGFLLSCLNSSINPVIYFLVGRKKGAKSKESMKAILQKVFKEDEVTQGR